MIREQVDQIPVPFDEKTALVGLPNSQFISGSIIFGAKYAAIFTSVGSLTSNICMPAL